MKTLHRPVWLVCIGVILLGCRGQNYPGAQRFALAGKITCDGEPVDLGTISFLPVGGGGEQRVSGGVIEDGAYTVPEPKGANEGKYRVEIRWAKKTGKQYFDRELSMMVDERKEGLPPRFHAKSELTAEVSDKQTVFDFHLTAK